MKIPFTRKTLLDWAGSRVFETGKTLFEKGLVFKVEYEHPFVEGEITYGTKLLKCRFKLLDDGSAANLCPCYDSSERGIICIHVIALGLELIRRNTDPLRAQKAFEEKRRADRLAGYDESTYIKRTPSGTPGAVNAKLRLCLKHEWKESLLAGQIPLLCEIAFNNTRVKAGDAPRNITFAFNKQDDNLLYVLEDICEGPATSEIDMRLSDFSNVLKLCPGKELYIENEKQPAIINAATMSSTLKIKLNNETGELELSIHTELPLHPTTGPYIYSPETRDGHISQPISGHLKNPARPVPSNLF